MALCSSRKTFVELRIEDWKSLSEVYCEDEVAELGSAVTTMVVTTVLCAKELSGRRSSSTKEEQYIVNPYAPDSPT